MKFCDYLDTDWAYVDLVLSMKKGCVKQINVINRNAGRTFKLLNRLNSAFKYFNSIPLL